MLLLATSLLQDELQFVAEEDEDYEKKMYSRMNSKK